MAFDKTRAAITQLTASGASTTLNAASGVGCVLLIRHSNGAGSVTAAATAQVQMQAKGGSAWYSPPAYLVAFGSTAAAVEDRAVAIPDGVGSVRVVYTAPTGPTGFTLDAEAAWATP